MSCSSPRALVNYYMELEILNVSIKCVSAAIICFGALSRLFLTSCLSVFCKKKLGRMGKDRPTGINLRRSLGFPDRENLRTLAPP